MPCASASRRRPQFGAYLRMAPPNSRRRPQLGAYLRMEPPNSRRRPQLGAGLRMAPRNSRCRPQFWAYLRMASGFCQNYLVSGRSCIIFAKVQSRGGVGVMCRRYGKGFLSGPVRAGEKRFASSLAVVCLPAWRSNSFSPSCFFAGYFAGAGYGADRAAGRAGGGSRR